MKTFCDRSFEWDSVELLKKQGIVRLLWELEVKNMRIPFARPGAFVVVISVQKVGEVQLVI